MGAAGIHPLGRGTDHLGDRALVVAPLQLGIAEQDTFAGQGAVDEDRLAVQVGESPSVMGQGFNAGLDRLRRQRLTSSDQQRDFRSGGKGAG